LTSGKVTLGSYNFTFGTLKSASSSNYFVTNGTGSLRSNVGTTSVAFPIGLASSYDPATITNSGTVDTFAVRVQSTFNTPPADTTKTVSRQWTIGETTPGSANAAITFQWNAGEVGSLFSTANTVFVSRDSAGTWIPSAATISGTGPYTATTSGWTSFSNFIVTNDSAVVTGVSSPTTTTPHTYALGQNYPNPFNPTTTISFDLPKQSDVTLKVYDLMGREVATLLNTTMQAGSHTALWNASRCASGVYFYKLAAGTYTAVKKLTLVK
jgi:hypothetical protein